MQNNLNSDNLVETILQLLTVDQKNQLRTVLQHSNGVHNQNNVRENNELERRGHVYNLRPPTILPVIYINVERDEIKVSNNKTTRDKPYTMSCKKFIVTNFLQKFNPYKLNTIKTTNNAEECAIMKTGDQFAIYVEGTSVYVSDYGIDRELRKILRTFSSGIQTNTKRAREIKAILKHESIPTPGNTVTAYKLENYLAILKKFKISKKKAEENIKNVIGCSSEERIIKAISNYHGDRKKFLSGLKVSYQRYLKKANGIQKAIKYPQAIETYLKETKRYFQKDKHNADSENEIANVVSKLYDVDAEHVKNVYHSGSNLALTPYDVGYRFSDKARKISNCLRSFAYILDIKCSNSVFNILNSIVTTCPRFKGPNTKGAVFPNIPKKNMRSIFALDIPTFGSLQQKIQNRADIPFNITHMKRMDFSPMEQTAESFYNKIKSGDMYLALKELWYLRHSFGIPMRTVHQFAKFLLQDFLAGTWIHMMLAAIRVKMDSVEDLASAAPPILLGPTIEPIIKTLIEVKDKLEGRDKDKLVQIMIPAMLCYWFRPRQTNAYIFRVISKPDWDSLKEDAYQFPMLMFGINLICHSDGTFQLFKTETKTSGRKAKEADISLYDKEIYDRYPYSVDFLRDIVTAYNNFTGNNIPTETEKRWYISNEKPAMRSGYRVFQYYSFPLITPVYPVGNKQFLMPDVKLERGQTVYASKNAPEILSGSKYKSPRCWGIRSDVESYLKKQKISLYIGKERKECNVKAMLMPNIGRMENYVMVNSSCSNSIRVSMGLLTQIFADSVNNSCITLKKKYKLLDGKRSIAVDFLENDKVVPYKVDPRLQSYRHGINAGNLGRYFSGSNQLQINDELNIRCLKDIMQSKLNKLKREEAHISEYVLKTNYDAYLRYDTLNDFAKLSSKIYRGQLIERLSSHPNCQPGANFTFANGGGLVSEKESDKSLKERCSDMRNLSIRNGEQTAQIIVCGDFYDSLDQMRALKDELDTLPNEFNIKLKELEDTLTAAKNRWREKFGVSLMQQVKNISQGVIRALSPRRSNNKRVKL